MAKQSVSQAAHALRTKKAILGERQKLFGEEAFTINVRQDDVELGSPDNAKACAVALSCRRRFADLQCVLAERTRLSLVFNDHYEVYGLTRTLRGQIESYDEEGAFIPGQYKVVPLPDSQRRKPVGKVSGAGNGRATPIKARRALRGIA